MKKSFSTRLLSLVMSVMMTVMLLPALALSASGAAKTPRYLYVGDTTVINNKVVQTTEGASWSYDVSTNTLTLKGGPVITAYENPDRMGVIYCDGSIEIVLEAYTIIESSYANYDYDSMDSSDSLTHMRAGIVASNLKISGDGTLMLVSGCANNSYGIYCNSLELNGSTVNLISADATYESVALSVSQNLSINDTKLDVQSKNANNMSAGIFANNIVINNSEISSDSAKATFSAAIYATNDLSIKDSIVAAFGGEADSCSRGLCADNNLSIDSGNVRASGKECADESTGIFSGNSICLNGGYIAAFGSESNFSEGIFASNGIVIKGGDIHAFASDAVTESDAIFTYGDICIEGGTTFAFTSAENAEYSNAIAACSQCAQSEESKSSGGGTISITGGAVLASVGAQDSNGRKPDKETYSSIWADNGITISDDIRLFGAEEEYTEKIIELRQSKKLGSVRTIANSYIPYGDENLFLGTDKWFSDVHGIDHWAVYPINYAYKNSLMTGISDDIFDPDGYVTRAMLVTILYRLEGKPDTSEAVCVFDDVAPDSYYESAAAWAFENNIVTGVSATKFAPDSKITREQISAIIYRYALYKGYDVSVGENTNILSYNDFTDISEYAIPAIQYTAGSGLMKGKTDSTINPRDFATRAEIATVLYRFIAFNQN